VAEFEFNEAFLTVGGEQATADLSIFSRGNRVLPGTYVTDIYLNSLSRGQRELRFVGSGDSSSQNARPCITRDLLAELEVKVDAFPALDNTGLEDCITLETAIPSAALSHDAARHRLSLSIPQAALARQARGTVDRSRWDSGVTAARLDYQFNVAHNDHAKAITAARPVSPTTQGAVATSVQQSRRDTMYGAIRFGFNLGDWRLRHNSNYNRGFDGRSRWQALNTYLQRDLPAMNGQLVMGDGSTPGNIFDSMQFRGVQVSSDDAMLPDSLQGYAPTIRGVAQSNARVTVRQNGFLIYNTYVAPGPFVIDDLYPTSSGGDLEVTVTEADGRETRFVQGYSALPTLLREKSWRYSGTFGEYRNGYDNAGATRPVFAQATMAYGASPDLTVYSGMTLASRYQSLIGGIAYNLRSFGAVSADVSFANPQDHAGKSHEGGSVRFLYAKAFPATSTDVRIAGYRYSTRGFRTFPEAVALWDTTGMWLPNRRDELRIDMAQRFGSWGSVYVSGQQQHYWDTGGRAARTVQAGYSNYFRQLGYNFYYSYNGSPYGGPASHQVTLSLTLPLGRTGANAQYHVSRDREGNVSQQASIFGSAFDDYRLSYGISAGVARAHGTNSENGSANASYRASLARFDASRSQGRDYGQTTFGMAGGMILHGGGLTLSQPLGETIAIAEVPKARGVAFDSQPGVSTDYAGIAVIPYLAPYRVNRLAIRTDSLGDSVEVREAATELVPTRGAVVRAKFDTAVGYRLLMTLTGDNGRHLPFGARVETLAGKEAGIVGPEGKTFISGAEPTGSYLVRWGTGPLDSCLVTYTLPDIPEPPPVRELSARCGTAHMRMADRDE